MSSDQDKIDSQYKMDLEIPATEEQNKIYESIFQEQEKFINSYNQKNSIGHHSTTETDSKERKKDKDKMNSNSNNKLVKKIKCVPSNTSTDNNEKSLEKISKQIEDSNKKKEDKIKKESSNLNININNKLLYY